MATNRLPNKLDQLITLAADMADGLKAQEANVGLKQNTEATMRADLDAARRTRNTYNTAVATSTRLTAAQTAADSNGKVFIGTAKAVLGNFLGNQWSPAWLPVGFLNNSLAVPSSIAERQVLLESIGNYLQANPDKQNGPLVTVARAGEVFTALKDVRAAVIGGNSAVTAAKTARDQAEQDLRTRMTGLINELGQLLEDDNPTWHAFGLNRPADPETPGIPDNLVLTAGLPGSIHVTWSAARRAARYRVYKKEDGETEYQPAATTFTPVATITGLKSGAAVQIQVSAANDAGESKACIPAQIVVPAEPAAATTTAA